MFRSVAHRLALTAARSCRASCKATSHGVVSKAESSVIRQTSRAVHGWSLHTPVLLHASPAESTINKDLVAELEHATGLEREELEGELQGKPRFETAPPQGPFGTKEAPAIVESQFDERIVGCSGGIGEEEHDVVWFKLKKDAHHVCAVCDQVFELKVIGEGGIPGQHH